MSRHGWTIGVLLLTSFGVFGFATIRAWNGYPADLGVAVLAIFLSSALWLAASIGAILGWFVDNALNALAAAFAAYAGVAAIDQANVQVRTTLCRIPVLSCAVVSGRHPAV